MRAATKARCRWLRMFRRPCIGFWPPKTSQILPATGAQQPIALSLVTAAAFVTGTMPLYRGSVPCSRAATCEATSPLVSPWQNTGRVSNWPALNAPSLPRCVAQCSPRRASGSARCAWLVPCTEHPFASWPRIGEHCWDPLEDCRFSTTRVALHGVH